MRWIHTTVAVGLMVLGIGLTQFVSRAETIPPHKSLSSFPLHIGEWKGREDRFDGEVYDILGVDDSFLANYQTPEGRPVQLYVGFYQSQREGDIIHSPKNCMPGAGWKIIENEYAEIRPKGEEGKEPVRVIKMTLENAGQKQAMLYWFQSRGRIISSEYWQKIYLVLDSVFRRRTDGSFVRLLAPVPGQGTQEAFRDLTEFAEQVMPVLNTYIPS